MNEINNTNINKWIDKFLDGETSCAEERELYSYFSQPELPPEAEPYREMFAWYASLQQQGESELPDANEQHTAQENSKVRILRLRTWQWVSVAATIALLFTIGFIFRPAPTTLNDEYLAYQGSYIIRDGKKITDLSIVVPEILKAEQLLDEKVGSVDRSFDEMDNAMMNSVASNFDMSDSTVREAVEAVLE